MASANMIVQSDESKICVVMVGLPARGKSLIAGKGMSHLIESDENKLILV